MWEEKDKRLIFMNWNGGKREKGAGRVTYDSSDTFGNDID